MGKWIRLVVVAAGIALVAGIAFLIRHVDSPRVVASAVAPDGTEFRVVQSFNWDLEFFTTSCYYRRPGGRWGWFYYDHEDWYWGSGRADVDPETGRINVYRRDRVVATFEWESERFRLLRRGMNPREYTGAQEWMPAGWSIRDQR